MTDNASDLLKRAFTFEKVQAQAQALGFRLPTSGGEVRLSIESAHFTCSNKLAKELQSLDPAQTSGWVQWEDQPGIQIWQNAAAPIGADRIAQLRALECAVSEKASVTIRRRHDGWQWVRVEEVEEGAANGSNHWREPDINLLAHGYHGVAALYYHRYWAWDERLGMRPVVARFVRFTSDKQDAVVEDTGRSRRRDAGT